MRFPLASWAPVLLVPLVALSGCADDEVTPTDPLPSEPRPTRWVVPDDFDTIGAALLATVGGDTVQVRPGTYEETSLYVPRSVVLIGAGPDSVVVDATAYRGGTVLQVSDRIESSRPGRIQGLTVRTAGARPLDVRDGEHVVVEDCRFEGGALGIVVSGARAFTEADFVACTFVGFEIPGFEAALEIQGFARVSIRHSSFLDNRSHAGAALRIGSPLATAIVEGSDFVGNVSDRAGAIEIRGPQQVQFFDCTFRGNVSESSAGAVLVRESRFVLFQECSFEENLATDEGGALWMQDVGRAGLIDVDFHDNVAPAGGALLLDATDAVLQSCVLARNGARVDDAWASTGGAIRLQGDVRLDVQDSIFHANRARGFFGADGVDAGSSIYSVPTALRTNILDLDGAILAFASQGEPLGGGFAALRVRDTNVFGNDDGDWVGPLAPFEGTENNTSADPMFCDPDQNDFGQCDGASRGAEE